MSLETAQFIHQMNPSFPGSNDRTGRGDDHIRLIKSAIQNTFPGIQGPLDPSVTHSFLNTVAQFLVPVGSIMLWFGSTPPPGWVICNGQLANRTDGSGSIQTPDMRGRVPVGVTAGLPLGAEFGQSIRNVTTAPAGDHAHTGATNVSGEHSHAATGQAVTATTGINITPNIVRLENEQSQADAVSRITVNDPGHTHNINVATTANGAHDHVIQTNTSGAHAHSVSVDVTQPSVALNYIMKV